MTDRPLSFWPPTDPYYLVQVGTSLRYVGASFRHHAWLWFSRQRMRSAYEGR